MKNSFRTEVPISRFPFNIDYGTKMLFLGSCFSDNISQKLADSGFAITSNPFGVLYNPSSIKSAIEQLLSQTTITEEDLIYHQGLYHSFWHHGTFSRVDSKEVLKLANSSITENTEYL